MKLISFRNCTLNQECMPNLFFVYPIFTSNLQQLKTQETFFAYQEKYD